MGIDIPPQLLIQRARLSFMETRAAMQRLAPLVAKQKGFAETDYRDVIRALKRETIPNDQLEARYRTVIDAIDPIIRREGIVDVPQRPMVMRLGTEAESAAQPAPHFLPAPLVGNTGQQGQFVLPLGNPNLGAGERFDDFNFPAVAWTLNDLGNTQRALGDLQASLTSYGEAVAIRRELAMANPAAYRPDVATSLAKLGIVQRNLDQLELARASYQESQTIYRELALTKPDLYRPALAGALVWLGDVQWALNMPEAAQVKFENALTIFREMDEVKPGVFGPLWRIR